MRMWPEDTLPTVVSVYSGVILLHGLCIVTFLAKLNGLDLWATDVGNAYLDTHQ